MDIQSHTITLFRTVPGNFSIMPESLFHNTVTAICAGPLKSRELTTLQVNIGYRCNLACTHCHISCSPSRTEMMTGQTIADVLAALERSGIRTLDITGGAPELNSGFRGLLTDARKLGLHVIVRTNLSIFFEPGMADLPKFYHDYDVELVASLPCYQRDAVDRVRGNGTFDKSIAALRQLNDLGYGTAGGRTLNLVYNPPDTVLSPLQSVLEAEYRRELKLRYDISFSKLYIFTNMPIGRFKDALERSGNVDRYLDQLKCAFNPAALDGIMCRSQISVGWDGRLYDCDFNQVIGLGVASGMPMHISQFDREVLADREISTGEHCFGCTAGQGST